MFEVLNLTQDHGDRQTGKEYSIKIIKQLKYTKTFEIINTIYY